MKTEQVGFSDSSVPSNRKVFKFLAMARCMLRTCWATTDSTSTCGTRKEESLAFVGKILESGTKKTTKNETTFCLSNSHCGQIYTITIEKCTRLFKTSLVNIDHFGD